MKIKCKVEEDGSVYLAALNEAGEHRKSVTLEPGQEVELNLPDIDVDIVEVGEVGDSDGEAQEQPAQGEEEAKAPDGGSPEPEAATDAPRERQAPSGVGIGRAVTYRSRTGSYDVPAVINATIDTLNPAGVESGNVPAISEPGNVHLTVFTPGKEDTGTDDPAIRTSENRGGSYQEWDIPHYEAPEGGAEDAPAEPTPGTWRWPERV